MKPFKYSWLVILLVLMLVVSACGDAATSVPATVPAGDATAPPAGDATAPPAAGPTNTVEPTAVSLGGSGAKTTITIWHGWSGNYLAAKQAVFAAYVAAHPDVAIK